MNINIPYGKSFLKFNLPKERFLGVLQNKDFEEKSVKKLLLKALRRKIVPFSKKKVLIVVPDGTRSGHLREMLPVLLKEISHPSRSITIIVATGLHKKHSPEELKRLLGYDVLKRHRILQHDPSAESSADLGMTEYGVPAALDKNLFDHDFIITIGVIEPHLYAGYSGGAKTVSIGLAGEATINATHSVRFLDDPATNIGSLKDNIFQKTLWHIIGNIGPVFSINTVNSSEGKAVRIFAGPVRDVFTKGTDYARRVFEVESDTPADIAVCGIGYPKDVNLYQASRAINYILNVDRPVVRPGGVVIVAAELSKGPGESAAEKRFYDELKRMRSPRSFVNHIKAEGCIAGEHRAYMVAKALVDYNVIFAGNGDKPFMESLPFRYCADAQSALRLAEDIAGSEAKIYAIPRALATIANLKK